MLIERRSFWCFYYHFVVVSLFAPALLKLEGRWQIPLVGPLRFYYTYTNNNILDSHRDMDYFFFPARALNRNNNKSYRELGRHNK